MPRRLPRIRFRWDSTADKVNAGYAVALVIVTLIGLGSIAAIQRFASTVADISDTHNALLELHTVLTNLTFAESGQRGFVITGDEAYVEHMDELMQASIAQIHVLRERTFADAAQQQRLGLLGTLTGERARIIREIIQSRRDLGEAAAEELVRTGRGKAVMDSIRVVAEAFERAELSRLAARGQSAMVRSRVATAIIALGSGFGFLVVLVSGMAMRRDYTERRRAEYMLRESETLLSQFMENLPIGVIVIDAKMQPRFANNAAVDVLGPTVLIDDGSHPLPLFRVADRRPYPAEETPLTRALHGETSTVDDAAVRVADRYVPIEISAAPIYDAAGRIAYAIAAFGDMTERRRAEAALRAARDTAEDASRTKSEFLARMSHELRTPLNSVIGFANILLRNRAGNLRDQDVAYLDRILDNGKHLLLLINDILDLSKIEAGRIEVENETFDLAELLEDVAAQFEAQVRETDVELRTEIPAGMAPVFTDPARMRQIMINLVGNAVKFTEKGRVLISVTVDPDTARPARISVSDTGIGIPDHRLEAIFDAFEQAESTTSRKYGGTGLGLPISRALCELLGYDLNVRSRVGHGSEFTIDLLPARQRPTGAAGAHTDAGQDGRAAGGERLVLVVDDEADSRILLTHYVEEFGCRAIATHSAASALRLARELRPDLITLDLVMPDMNGWDILTTLKADAELAEIPVVVISVIAQENRATLLGAIDVLQKPVERNALFAVLRRNLGDGSARIPSGDDSTDDRSEPA